MHIRGFGGMLVREGETARQPAGAHNVPYRLSGIASSARRLRAWERGLWSSSASAAARIVWLFVAVGIAARLIRFALKFPLWCDEYQLAANLLRRDFSELALPLSYNQVAPLGFLWMELASVRLFGFSEWSLRLFPLACGIASVLLFRDLAVRTLNRWAGVLAVAIFSCAYYPIRYSVEVKPYSADLLAAVVLLSCFAAWRREAGKVRWLWIMAALIPILFAVSFSAAFVAGAVSLATGYVLWNDRVRGPSASQWLAWGSCNVVIVVAFGGLYALSISGQYDATRREMVACWADAFPPWSRPLELLVWLARAHTSEMFAYPAGSENGGSLLTAMGFAAGILAFWRSGRREWLVVIGVCFGLSLLAATLHRYPYGGHARLCQHLAPLVCLLAAAGFAQVFGSISQVPWRLTAFRLSLGACLLLGLAIIARDIVHPWKDRRDVEHREFARRFWAEEPGVQTICLQADLGRKFYDRNFEPPYLCNQRLLSPAHHLGSYDGSVRMASADLPLKCVVFHSACARCDERALQAWLDEMSRHYDLQGTESRQQALSSPDHREHELFLLCYDVYRFTPRASAGAHAGSATVAEATTNTAKH